MTYAPVLEMTNFTILNATEYLTREEGGGISKLANFND